MMTVSPAAGTAPLTHVVAVPQAPAAAEMCTLLAVCGAKPCGVALVASYFAAWLLTVYPLMGAAMSVLWPLKNKFAVPVPVASRNTKTLAVVSVGSAPPAVSWHLDALFVASTIELDVPGVKTSEPIASVQSNAPSASMLNVPPLSVMTALSDNRPGEGGFAATP